ncbi:BsuPI-related putative proteinase inhibitor [Fuchsiella alkaliacetigena]|uniref:BsuPI-related putative proteinase inhibitor n=1 Tax=Fuchsiella alkaliacetigena TaxID=957042 RepID=UPI00200B96CC|nr:BsuPI-related putative proteinase inhibitor [Fuchsiella alkaliacetigena]MCK8826115.1 BsuPI-related putative proteinase inhibitor [Fuchsiella alkaliacetigena]
MLKNNYYLAIIISLLILLLFNFNVFAETDNLSEVQSLKVADIEVEFEAVNDSIDEQTLVSLNELWDELEMSLFVVDDKIIVGYQDYYFLLTLDEDTIYAQNVATEGFEQEDYSLKQAPTYENRRLFIPLEFITEHLGLEYQLKEFAEEKKEQEEVETELEEEREEELKIDKIKNLELDLRLLAVEDEEIEVGLKLKNLSKQEIELHFSTGQKYDFILKNEKGEVVASWSTGQSFTQALETLDLAGEESISYTETMNIKDLEAGTYYLQGVITTRQELISEPIQFRLN